MRTIKTFENKFDEKVAYDYFYETVENGIKSLDLITDRQFYLDCSFDECFKELQQIFDEDRFIGNGINFGEFAFIVDEESIDEISNVFDNARDNAYDDYAEDLYDEYDYKNCTPYDCDDELSYDFEKWLENGEMNSRFDNDDEGRHYYKIFNNTKTKEDAICIYFDAGGKINIY